MRGALVLVVIALVASAAEGRPRTGRRPQILPNTLEFTQASSENRKSVPRRSGASDGSGSDSDSGRAIGFGAEIGFLGKANSTSADALGLQMAWGLRLVARIPIWEQFYLKPSVGYFRRSQGAGSSSVTENTFELGLTAQYAVLRGKRVKLLAGLAQRVDGFVVNIAIANASTSSPMTFTYRLGPELGIAVGLTQSMSLIIDADLTFGSSRTHFGTAAGLLFFLPN